MAKENLPDEEIKKFAPLDEETIEFFNKRLDSFALSIPLEIYFQSATNLKQLIKITKIPEQYSIILEKELLVQVNPNYYDAFINDEEILTILFDKEIDKIEANSENGKIKLSKPNFEANMGLIQKYTYDEVQRAIEMEKLITSQKEDTGGEELETSLDAAPKKKYFKKKK